MPQMIVKRWLGKTDRQKTLLADKLTKEVIGVWKRIRFGWIREIEFEEWNEKV